MTNFDHFSKEIQKRNSLRNASSCKMWTLAVFPDLVLLFMTKIIPQTTKNVYILQDDRILNAKIWKMYHQNSSNISIFLACRKPEISNLFCIFLIQNDPQCTVNIFVSHSGHLNNRIIERFFFIFPHFFAVEDDFTKWRVPNVQQNLEKIIKYSKNLGKMKKTLKCLLLFKWLPLEP